MTAIIEVKGLCKKYGNNLAVNNLHFNVLKGEIFGLLGPNGAGKSTTLEILETLKDKTDGEVIVCGHNIDTEKAIIKNKIGVQLQTSGFYPGLTLKELLLLFSGLYNVKTDYKELLRKVELEEKANATVKELSGGQKQRFSIATTLINRPEIIFLDEPTTGLDPNARRSLWNLIQSLNKEGTTIVLTTHYMEEAELLCNRVGIINEGKIMALDCPDVLIDNLLSTGFKRTSIVKEATLDDVFINLTGKNLIEN